MLYPKKTRKNLRKISLASLALTAFLVGPATESQVLAQERQLTITTFGGPFKDAQNKAYFEPFAKATGIKVTVDEWAGEMAKLRAMVQSGNVTWDVLDTSGGQVDLGCDEGLLEKPNPSDFGGADAFVEGTIVECGIPVGATSVVIGYDASKFPNGEPTTLADFWDVKKFPGPRAMKRWPKHNLELALLADGVSPNEVYKVLGTEEGIDRAFRKLDEIKPYVKVWFQTWAQPGQLLADGEVAMTVGTSESLVVTAQTQKNVKFMWDHQGWGLDWWSIVSGAKNKEEAKEFIKFASQPENMSKFIEYMDMGPPVKAVLNSLSPEKLATLPTSPENLAKGAWPIDSRFWGDNLDTLEVRFQQWLNK